MMRNYFLLFTLFSGLSLQAQFGIQASATFNQASDEFVTGLATFEGPEFDPGVEVAVNYWFRLPKQRVEFSPTVYYARSGVEASDASLSEYGAQMKVNVYPFDFLGDCDCPTFGKQGPQLQKGLFLQVSGGYAFYDLSSDNGFEVASQEDGSGLTYGGAIGLDFGLSNLVTLTPIGGVRFGAAPYQETVFRTGTNPEGVTYGPKLTTFYAGLQVSFRFDHKKY